MRRSLLKSGGLHISNMYTSRSRAHAASSQQTLKLFQVKDAEEEEEEEPEHDGTGGANHNKYCHFCQHVKVSPHPTARTRQL